MAKVKHSEQAKQAAKLVARAEANCQIIRSHIKETEDKRVQAVGKKRDAIDALKEEYRIWTERLKIVESHIRTLKTIAMKNSKSREWYIRELAIEKVAKETHMRKDTVRHNLAQLKLVFEWDNDLAEPCCHVAVAVSGRPGTHHLRFNEDLEIVHYECAKPPGNNYRCYLVD